MHKNSFEPKTLEGNWFEERCTTEYDVGNKSATYMRHPSAGKFTLSSQETGCIKSSEPNEKFFTSTSNWMNFQPGVKDTFQTTSRQDFGAPETQDSKFSLKDNYLTKDSEKIEEYRKKWTAGGHNFNRTYLGAKQFVKANQDEE